MADRTARSVWTMKRQVSLLRMMLMARQGLGVLVVAVVHKLAVLHALGHTVHIEDQSRLMVQVKCKVNAEPSSLELC